MFNMDLQIKESIVKSIMKSLVVHAKYLLIFLLCCLMSCLAVGPQAKTGFPNPNLVVQL